MASKSEAGMARLLGSFERLREKVNTFNGRYKPANDLITRESLGNTYKHAKEAIDETATAENLWRLAVDDRAAMFKNLPGLITRIRNTVKSLQGSDAAMEDLDTIVRQLRGKRKSAAKPPAPTKLEAGEQPKDPISSSQQSYDHQVAQFSQLIDLLEAFTFYTPNEEDLNLKALKQMLTTMRNANTAVSATQAALDAQRILRNNIFFASNTGLVDSAQATKNYIKAAFTVKSPEYAMIKSLTFRSRKL